MKESNLHANNYGKCDNRCVFCSGFNIVVRSHSSLIKSLEDCIKNGSKEINIEGMDACQYDKLVELVERAKDLGIEKIALSTHARRLVDDSLLLKLKKAGLTELRIPLYGSTEKIHNEVVQSTRRSKGSAFLDTTIAISNSSELGIAIKGHSIFLENNKEDLKNVLDLFDAITKNKLVSFQLHPAFLMYKTKIFKSKVERWYLPFTNGSRYIREFYKDTEKDQRVSFLEMPYCVFGKFTKKVFNEVAYSKNEIEGKLFRLASLSGETKHALNKAEDLAFYREKSYFSACERCAIKKLCCGVSTTEINMFGVEGLRPITNL